MALNKESIVNLYGKRASAYDLSANAYYILGFREFAYRKWAAESLALKPGDTVVEIGCGTGLNLRLLRDAVGASGRIIGVDISPAMLAKAEDRVERNGWNNVELICQDATAYTFPGAVQGVISTFAVTLIAEYDRVIRNAVAALTPAGRIAILDFKKPDAWPLWLVHLFVLLTKPFGVSLDLAERRPWESIEHHAERLGYAEMYFGAVYLSVGMMLETTYDPPAAVRHDPESVLNACGEHTEVLGP